MAEAFKSEPPGFLGPTAGVMLAWSLPGCSVTFIFLFLGSYYYVTTKPKKYVSTFSR